MSLQRAEKFCKLCSEYYKGVSDLIKDYGSEKEAIKSNYFFILYRQASDFACSQVMQSLERLLGHLGGGKDGFELLKICKDCDRKQPNVANIIISAEKE